MALWTPFRAGERLTAGRLNAMISEWIPYTPIWSADSGTTTVGDAILTGKYQRIGNTINFRIFFQWGSTTTQSVGNANWRFSLPAQPQSADGPEFWPASAWFIHDVDDNPSNTTNYRFAGSAYVDPTRNAVYAITPNASNSFLDSQQWPSITEKASGQIAPANEPVRVGDQINIFGEYEAID